MDILQMTKILSVLTFLCLITAANASELCGEVGVRIAYEPLMVEGALLCFLYTNNTPGPDSNKLSVEPDGISILSMAKGRKPKLVYDLPYAGTVGKINDAFVIATNGNQDKRLFVLHSAEAPSTWDAVGDVYDVSVIDVGKNEIVLDKTLSRFFDMGADIGDSKGRIKFYYPYKDRRSVEKAISSPIFRSVRTSTSVDGVVSGKTLIYGGDLEPANWEPSKKYLLKGSRVTVEDSMGGWCKVSLKKGAEQFRKWLLCDAVVFPSVHKP